LAEQAATDSLTGLPNRRTFDAYLANQVAGRARRSRDTGLALLVLDLDHFKSVNDNYGHGVGDEVLREVSTRIREATRRGELCARLGGEEFAVVLPDTDQEEVAATAERFRHLIGDEPVDTSIGPLTITVSIGGGHTRGESHDDIATGLLRCADTALYRAKAAGRDRVSMSSID
ncbi:MAG: GGDEF domain-containing protein, partial [Acidimicrobiales bacterium]